MKSFLKIYITILLSYFSLINLGYAQDNSKSSIISDTLEMMDNQDVPVLFNSDEILILTIKTDMRALKKDMGGTAIYHPATITYLSSDSSPVSLKLKIKARGRFRKSKENCNFPPLKLNFPKKKTKNTIFHQQDKVKLVTHCKEKQKSYEQWLLEEYLIYKVYNLFSEFSIKARLAQITYIDTEGKLNPVTKHGFFIESEDMMAERNDGKIMKNKKIPPNYCNYQKFTLFCIFQYMIGNTDWGVRALHNVILVKLNNPLLIAPVAIPYDFDFSGIINAFYATPDPVLPIVDVSDRLWRCSCRTIEELSDHFSSFNEHKDEIYALYGNLKPLEEKYKNLSFKYYDKFYETINNPKKIERAIIRGCGNK